MTQGGHNTDLAPAITTACPLLQELPATGAYPQGKGNARGRAGRTQEVTTEEGDGDGAAPLQQSRPLGSLAEPATPVGTRTKFLLGLNVPSEYLTPWKILMAERQRDFFDGNIVTGLCIESWPGAARFKIGAFTFK